MNLINIMRYNPAEVLLGMYSIYQNLVFCFNSIITYKPVLFLLLYMKAADTENRAVTA